MNVLTDNINSDNIELNPFGEERNPSGSDSNLVTEHKGEDLLGQDENSFAAGTNVDRISNDLSPVETEKPDKKNKNFHKNERKLTDPYFLIVFVSFYTIVLCFIAYSVHFGDISRITKGYDSCGTVCGEAPQNSSLLDECYKSRTSFETKQDPNRRLLAIPPPKTLDELLAEKNSPETVCDTRYFLKEIFEDLKSYWGTFTLLCLLSLALSCGVFLLLRYCPEYMVWIVLLSFKIICLCTMIFEGFMFWWLTKKHNEEIFTDKMGLVLYMGFIIGATIMLVGGGLAITACMKINIELVIRLFQEVGKAAACMPGIFVTPILTLLAFGTAMLLWMYLLILIRSSGQLIKTDLNKFNFQMDGWMKTAEILNILGMLWMFSFIIGCQHMVVGGAVTKWYFTRYKSRLSYPIALSSYNLTRYHLGSVAIGSLCSSIIYLPHLMLKAVYAACKLSRMSESALSLYCDHIGSLIDKLHYWGKPTYTLVVKNGYSFFEARKQCVAKATEFSCDINEIKSVGDFVFILSKIMVLFVTQATALLLFRGEELQQPIVFLTLTGIFSLFISHSFITVYEMTIETMFICLYEQNLFDADDTVDDADDTVYVPEGSKHVHHADYESDAHLANMVVLPTVRQTAYPRTRAMKSPSCIFEDDSLQPNLMEYMKISKEVLKIKRKGMNKRKIEV